VTFLFSDIEDSSDLVLRLGDETFAAVRGEHRRLLREAFAAHAGSEIDTAGDGFFVAFATARDAIAAAVAAQLALAGFEWPADAEVRVRIGLHTAEPHVSEQGYVGIGVHRAARICEAARGGQILLSNATAGIVEDAELPGIELLDLGEHRLKGIPRDQRLFQLTVLALPSEFGPPRTGAAAQRPGVATFLLTDLAGWRHVIRAVGDEASEALASDYRALVAAAVEAHGGTAIDSAGDNVLAVFPEAGDAIRAAAAVRESLRDFSWPSGCDVRLSAVVHSGRWSGDPKRPGAGTAYVMLGRFAETAEPSQVLVSQATVALAEGDVEVPALRSLGERTLPELDEPVRLYELVEA
jgi:class 3 adenylate cyclase